MVAVLLPVGIVLGSTFSWVVPAQATWHVAGRDLDAAWRAFSYKVAPVPELPGLVLATAWAAGAAGLLAELISSWRRVPAVFALAAALGLYLFAAALGTGSWRVARPGVHGGCRLLVPRRRRPRARCGPGRPGRLLGAPSASVTAPPPTAPAR